MRGEKIYSGKSGVGKVGVMTNIALFDGGLTIMQGSQVHTSVIHLTAEELQAIRQHIVKTGRLSGIQLRFIAAVDQMETILSDKYAKIIVDMARCTTSEQMHEYIGQIGPSEDYDNWLKALRAMASFCLSEIIERRTVEGLVDEDDKLDDTEGNPEL
jgi:hypothetical protein